MASIQKPEDIFQEFTADFLNIYGKNLVSIILFGSAAGADYNPGVSDLNFLIVLSDEEIDSLDKALTVVTKWRKKKVATPLFMTSSYIESSLDSYPLEFLTMSRHHVVVFGRDVLEKISCDPEYLRLQCEREIKGKLLLLREGFLETEGKEKLVRELISASITAFISIFTGLLVLMKKDIPGAKRAIAESAAREVGIDGSVFLNCLDIKDKKADSSTNVLPLFMSYLKEVRKLWELVDNMHL